MNVGDYGFYYPANWVNGMPKVDDERWGKRCQIVDKRESLYFLVFDDRSGVTYASFREVKEKEVV